MANLDDLAVENFRAYLRIPTVQPNVDYSECLLFLRGLAAEIGLQSRVLEYTEKKPILVLTLAGKQPDLGSIVLNSHMDVVPVYPEFWDHDPFAADMDEDGNIFARGTQDTKGLGMQFLEAMRRLIRQGQVFKRTIHVLFVPDEEDGIDGMEQLVASSDFASLNVAFCLDEGDSNPGTEFFALYAEKAIWHTTFKVPGTDGHGSLPLKNTAGEKLRRLIDRVMDYRQRQMDKLDADPTLTVSDITFVNLTELEGGLEPNLVPAELSATFDFRLAVNEDHDKFEALLRSWCDASGDNIEIDYVAKEPATPPTAIDQTNPYFTAMKRVLDHLGQPILTKIMAGGTDSRFLRRVGVPCISFSPINHTPDRAHANNEFLNRDVFLRGIEIFCDIIPAIANLD